jgi:hypothetical protein
MSPSRHEAEHVVGGSRPGSVNGGAISLTFWQKNGAEKRDQSYVARIVTSPDPLSTSSRSPLMGTSPALGGDAAVTGGGAPAAPFVGAAFSDFFAHPDELSATAATTMTQLATVTMGPLFWRRKYVPSIIGCLLEHF